MFFYDKVNELCREKGISITTLAIELGFSKGTPTNWKKMTTPPRAENVKKIADYFGVPVSYFNADENGGITSNRFLTPEYRALVQEALKVVKTKIPVLGDVAAGLPIEVVTDILDYEEISPELTKDGSEYFALRIKGDSMEPKISDGDVVIVRKQEDVDSGQIAIVCVNGENATCKKVMKQSGGILLQPLNPSFTPTFYTTEDILKLPVTILGRVVELRAKF